MVETDFIQDSYASPCASALAFTATLVELRTGHALKPILNFIQEISAKCVDLVLILLAHR